MDARFSETPVMTPVREGAKAAYSGEHPSPSSSKEPHLHSSKENPLGLVLPLPYMCTVLGCGFSSSARASFAQHVQGHASSGGGGKGGAASGGAAKPPSVGSCPKGCLCVLHPRQQLQQQQQHPQRQGAPCTPAQLEEYLKAAAAINLASILDMREKDREDARLEVLRRAAAAKAGKPEADYFYEESASV
jgi:hypothetical protein